MPAPSIYYTQQKEHFAKLLDKFTKDFNRVAMLRLWCAIGTITAGIWALSTGTDWLWWLCGIAAVLFLVLVRIHTRLANKQVLTKTRISIVENEIKALEGDHSSFADGTAYINTAHPYSYDLDLYGKGSIYQMLCRAVTKDGAHLLANKLATLSLSKEAILERQAIIKELGNMPELLLEFRVAGSVGEEADNDKDRLTQWLQGDELFINNIVICIAALLMPVLSIACIIYSIVIGSIYAGFWPVILCNWLLLGTFSKKTKSASQQIGNTAPLIDKYESLLKQVISYSYTNQWLQQTSAEAQRSLDGISRLKKLLQLFDSRGNGMVWPVMNTFFLFDFYCMIRLEAWRRKYKSSILAAIETMVVTDVYISCAVYAFNHPEYIYPKINTDGCRIEAKNLRHPLLPSQNAVGNDVSIGHKEQFYLLTGANMTGKSTFIRTIGVSNVLCNMGLPMPADELSFPLLALYTSMRITDSVQDDISYFKAELNRIKMIMDELKVVKSPCLILLDEPLRGTNSVDKQQGTRSILEKLLMYHAIGIIATHDTGLCDLEANYPSKVSNYHFESGLNNMELLFDFKLKHGCSTSNNATILMQQMGIINKPGSNL